MPTPNYGWVTPTVNGDLGAWGTKINQCFTDADEDLKATDNKATSAQSSATAAQTTANNAYTLAQSVQASLGTKILVYTRAPTGSDSAADGTLWCQVNA